MEYMFKGLAHIGIRTDDPRKCAEFYINNLDFRLLHVVPRDGFEIIFVENAGVVLEFIGRKGPDSAGIVDHITFEVNGIEKTVERLKAAGVKMDSDTPRQMEGFFPFPCKNIFFTGPAGERVELFDYSL